MKATEKKDTKLAQIELAKLYEEDIAVEIPLSWKWDKRYIDSLSYIHSFTMAVAGLNCKVGDLILEFARGSGWATEWLNRLGYKTVQ